MIYETFLSPTIEHIIDNLLVSEYRVLSSEESVHCIFGRDIFNLDEIQNTWEGRELLRAPFLLSGWADYPRVWRHIQGQLDTPGHPRMYGSGRSA